MKYIKVFEEFNKSEIKELKQGLSDVFVELVDNGFDIDYNFDKSYNSRDEVSIRICRLNGGSTSLLYDYSDVSDYIKMAKDYMDIYYNNDCSVSFQYNSVFSTTHNYKYDIFISDQEDDIEEDLPPTRFLVIKLIFTIK